MVGRHISNVTKRVLCNSTIHQGTIGLGVSTVRSTPVAQAGSIPALGQILGGNHD